MTKVTNSDPPSDESSSGIPQVVKHLLRQSMRPGPLLRPFDYGPIRVVINNDKVVIASIVKIICTDALEGILGQCGGYGGGGGIEVGKGP